MLLQQQKGHRPFPRRAPCFRRCAVRAGQAQVEGHRRRTRTWKSGRPRIKAKKTARRCFQTATPPGSRLPGAVTCSTPPRRNGQPTIQKGLEFSLICSPNRKPHTILCCTPARLQEQQRASSAPPAASLGDSVADAKIDEFNSAVNSLDDILDFFDSSNSYAEPFYSKINGFKAIHRGVIDVRLLVFRLEKRVA